MPGPGLAGERKEDGVMAKCKSCRYSFLADIGEEGKLLTACVYILRTGSRRPCPFGRDCTAYRRRETRTDRMGGEFDEYAEI